MSRSDRLPIIQAPAFRETKDRKTWTGYLRSDLEQVKANALEWQRTKPVEEIANQVALGNSKEYTTVVDGSRTKPISQSTRRVDVYFISAVLTRTLGRAKDILARAILRTSKRHTGLLSQGWVWYRQTGGKGGTLDLIGETLPTDLRIKRGTSLILAPQANYAWFANYYAKRDHGFKTKRRKRVAMMANGRQAPAPNSVGFMAYAAKRLRPDLKKIGFSVFVIFTAEVPPSPHGIRNRRNGYRGPVLIFTPYRFAMGQGG